MKLLILQPDKRLATEEKSMLMKSIKESVKEGVLLLDSSINYEQVEITPSRTMDIADFMKAIAAVPKKDGLEPNVTTVDEELPKDAIEEPLMLVERKTTEAIGSYADLKVGDRFKFTDKKGRKHEVEVAAEEDNLIQVVWTHTVEDKPWNNEGGTEGGYLDSDIREYLNEELYEDLPEGFKAQIKADVNNDYLRLLTKKEVFGVDGEKPSLKMFEDTHNRVAMDGYNGNCSNWWWLADVYSSAYACHVNYNGYSNYNGASHAFGVRPTCLLMR